MTKRLIDYKTNGLIKQAFLLLPIGFYYLAGFRLLTAWVRREIFLAEVFLWKMPFEHPFWMSGIAFNRAFLAPSVSFSSIASRTFLTELFTVDSKLRFRTLPFSFCFALLIADGWIAKIQSPFFSLKRYLIRTTFTLSFGDCVIIPFWW